MTTPPVSPDDVLRAVDRIRAENQRRMAGYERVLAEIGGLTGEGFSFDGSVRAEVDEDGVVARIDIADEALRRGGHLAEMVLAAIREAQAARALKLAELGARMDGGATLAAVRDAIPAATRDTIEQRGGPRG